MFDRNEAAPKKSFLSWVGGKSQLSEKIIPLMPDHRCYCEVFAGAAWVLFKKPESKSEVINDINVDLVTLYRVIQHHLEEFVRYFKWVLVSRDEFERLKRVDPTTLTDIQRSARFYYLIRMRFSSNLNSPSMGVATTRGPRLNLLRIEEELSAAHLRLSSVYIENLHFTKLIDRYDRPHTFFYIDPPYYNCENHYGKGIFGRSDFNVLAARLAQLKGKFIMSINDTPEVRKIFGEFKIREVTTRYTVGNAKKSDAVTELLVMNYPPFSR
jgi:DNA adenine methylase